MVRVVIRDKGIHLRVQFKSWDSPFRHVTANIKQGLYFVNMKNVQICFRPLFTKLCKKVKNVNYFHLRDEQEVVKLCLEMTCLLCSIFKKSESNCTIKAHQKKTICQ